MTGYDDRALQPLLERVASRCAILNAPWDQGRGTDVDCAVEGRDPQWPLRAPAGWRVVRRFFYERGRVEYAELDGPLGVVHVDLREDPTGVAFGTDGLRAPAEVRAAYLEQKRLEMGDSALERWAARLRRAARPQGLRVLVVGPDGSGKSTLAERLPEVTGRLFRTSRLFHWRPRLLPTPGAAVGRAPIDQTAPAGRTPHGRLLSHTLLLYYFADFLLGSLVRQRPVLARDGLVVIERGWPDLEIDPVRFRLRVAPALVRALGRLLPPAELVLVLEAPAPVTHERKAELTPEEIERQQRAWRAHAPRGSAFIDTAQPHEAVAAAARATIVGALEHRTVSRVGSGWVRLDRPGGTGAWFPRDRRAAGAATALVAPVTPRAHRRWQALRLGASLGALRALPRTAPPREVRELLAGVVPPGGTYAVASSSWAKRYVALVLDREGVPVAFAKVAVEQAGRPALEHEAEVLAELRAALGGPVVAPAVLGTEEGVLVLEPVQWRPQPRGGPLQQEIAAALGALRRETGLAHGDLTPSNVLKTSEGFAIVDWEHASRSAPPYDDLFHFHVQACSFAGHPSVEELVAGVHGAGPVAAAFITYAAEAGIAEVDAGQFADYLQRSHAFVQRFLAADPPAEAVGGARRESAVRDELLAALAARA